MKNKQPFQSAPKFERVPEEMGCGTSRVGFVEVDFASIVETFGPPSENDGYKTDAHWVIRFADGTVATIYNYKRGRNYNGDGVPPVEEIRDWHVGGVCRRAFRLVAAALRLPDEHVVIE